MNLRLGVHDEGGDRTLTLEEGVMQLLDKDKTPKASNKASEEADRASKEAVWDSGFLCPNLDFTPKALCFLFFLFFFKKKKQDL
jgi:hypothetical protein